MELYCDTREHAKEWERISKQLDKLNIRYFRTKLFVGDYQSLDNARLVVDRKKDLLELCSNVCQQHERFQAELKRAEEAGIRIIVLCEHGDDIKDLSDVFFWQNPRREKTVIRMVNGKPRRVAANPKALTGEVLFKPLSTIAQRYHVQFELCNKRETGKRIVELLGGGGSGT
jgi:hypothetical protein